MKIDVVCSPAAVVLVGLLAAIMKDSSAQAHLPSNLEGSMNNPSSRIRRAADWWYAPVNLEVPNEWQQNRWYHWLLQSVREKKLNYSCLACVPVPLTQNQVMPIYATPVSEHYTRCLLSLMADIVKNGTQEEWNRTTCTSVVQGNTEKYFNRTVCLALCKETWIFPDDSTDKRLRGKADTIAGHTSEPEFCICRGVNQTCTNSTNNYDSFTEPGQFLGLSKCSKYEACEWVNRGESVCMKVNITLPGFPENNSLTVVKSTPGLGMLKGMAWICGQQYYTFLPPEFAGCCYLAKISTPLTIIPVHNLTYNREPTHRRFKREMATFSSKDYYHYRISLGEKWGIGLFPWYGVTFLADHIDNITADLFAYLTTNTKALEGLNNAARNHREVILKHEMVLDFLIAAEGGMCKTLNLNSSACCVLAPDPNDNISQLITELDKISSHFQPAEHAGWSAMDWLCNPFGQWGALLLQILVPIFVVPICFCTIMLTCMKALAAKCIGKTVGHV